jgi:hypothetical protein
MKNVDDNICIIKDDPPARDLPLNSRVLPKLMLHLLINMFDNRFELTITIARTENKIICNGTLCFYIKQNNVVGLLVFGQVHNPSCQSRYVYDATLPTRYPLFNIFMLICTIVFTE